MLTVFKNKPDSHFATSAMWSWQEKNESDAGVFLQLFRSFGHTVVGGNCGPSNLVRSEGTLTAYKGVFTELEVEDAERNAVLPSKALKNESLRIESIWSRLDPKPNHSRSTASLRIVSAYVHHRTRSQCSFSEFPTFPVGWPKTIGPTMLNSTCDPFCTDRPSQARWPAEIWFPKVASFLHSVRSWQCEQNTPGFHSQS